MVIIEGPEGAPAQPLFAAAFLRAASTLLSSSHFLLAGMCVPTLFLMNLSARLSLDTLSSSVVCSQQGAKPHSSLITSRINLVCLVSAALLAVPSLAHVLRHLVAIVEAHGHEVAQSHGCRQQRDAQESPRPRTQAPSDLSRGPQAPMACKLFFFWY